MPTSAETTPEQNRHAGGTSQDGPPRVTDPAEVVAKPGPPHGLEAAVFHSPNTSAVFRMGWSRQIDDEGTRPQPSRARPLRLDVSDAPRLVGHREQMTSLH